MQSVAIHDVRAHPGDSAFLIDDGECAILYDSGFGFTGHSVAENIKKILGGRELDYIFLTHSHYDHALGSAYVLEHWPNAQVAAGEYAAKIFAKPSAKAVMRELDGKFAAQCGVLEYEDLADKLRVDIPLADGDVIRAGTMEFTVLNLPGHTKCSVGYYCAENKLLLGSETIGVYNGEDDVVPSYLVGYDMAMRSIRRVAELDIENILVPHYGLLERERARMYLARAQESARTTAQEIISMLRAGKAREEIVEFFKEKFYHGYIRTIYPIDAMRLNTGITVDLLKREFGIQ